MKMSVIAGFGPALLLSFVSVVSHAAGDPVRGKQLAIQCFACHGTDGNSPSPVNPRIGGQHEQYLLLALQGYADGTRPNSLMTGAVLDKSEQDLEDMAAYFASQSAPAATAGQGKAKPPSAGRGGPTMAFDHGERDSEFTSMLVRAATLAAAATPAAAACATATNAGDADADGDGLADRYDAAPDDPNEFVLDTNGDGRYEICSIQQLQAIVTLGGNGAATGLSEEARRARSYQLQADLDAGGIAFEPVGNCGPTGNCMRALGQFGFGGVFDGQGHVIRNLRISAEERGGVGLFGVLSVSGVVTNLRLENVSINGRAGVGSVVGSNFGTVYRCAAEGTVTGAMAIGGLVGGSGGLVYDSSFAGQVTGKQAVGGLVGDMTGAIYRGRTAGSISGTRGIGGLVGLNTFGSIRDSNSAMNVVGRNDTGGLVGVNTDAKVRNSFAVGNVVGDSNNIGGLVGFNSQSSVRNSFAGGAVSGADAVGGLVGRNNGLVASSYASGAVSSDGATGAIVGFIVEGEVMNSYAAGDRSASDNPVWSGERTGWAPDALPVSKPLNFFCDENGNGFVDPGERRRDNYVWAFGNIDEAPEISCAPEIIAMQR